ncbi:MAG: DUF6484 domain-containing protein [Enhygromyxa sp.]
MSEVDEHPEPESVAEPAAADDDDNKKTGLLDELLAAPESSPTREPGTQPAVALGTRVGKLVEWSAGSPPLVEFEGNERGPLAARSVIPLDPSTIAEAIASARGVLLTFEDGRPDAPIITGLLHDLAALDEPPQIWDEDEEAPSEAPDPSLAEVEARVDGKRVELEAADEIVLRCGQASIVLRRNGRVVIRGTYVETRSRGVNRVKGGSVEIN